MHPSWHTPAWHAHGGIGENDPLDEFARFRVAGQKRVMTTRESGQCRRFEVEAEFGFAVRCVRDVAGKATVGKEGPDFAVEFAQGFGIGRRENGCERDENAE